MTLREIIDSRGSKYDEDILNHDSLADYWQGYELGWKCAYHDIRKILDHFGFDTNIVVIKENTCDQ